MNLSVKHYFQILVFRIPIKYWNIKYASICDVFNDQWENHHFKMFIFCMCILKRPFFRLYVLCSRTGCKVVRYVFFTNFRYSLYILYFYIFFIAGLGDLGVTCSPRNPRFAGSNPAEVDGFYQDLNILSISPPGGT